MADPLIQTDALARARELIARIDDLGGAVLSPDDGWLDPQCLYFAHCQ